MTYDQDKGREDLLAFEAEQPKNFWTGDRHLQRIVRRWAGEEAVAAWAPDLERFGAETAGPVDQAVRLNDLPHNLPRLDRWGPYGERKEEVEFHPSYHEAGRYIYGSGVVAALADDGGNLRSLTLSFLSGLNGEAGHNCPVACTLGVVKSIKALGTDTLKEKWLPRLLSTDYEHLAHGAQFLTEVQGGSDVGANAVRAVPEPGQEGVWRVTGEKWFCSNATADLILITARPEGAPEGTRGLGLFLVPRRLEDRSLNRYFIRRTKEKLGTRTMASGEIDFEGALAYQLGPLKDGFKNMMRLVINTSRISNAVGTAATARRACHVAFGYARRRRAFGDRIVDYPMVQETLADMWSETAAAMSGSLYLAHLVDQVDTGEASDREAAFLRMALNLNKMRSAQSGHEVVLSAIEVLGGNGAIETFSVLPRLLRDNVVYENWEGTHNVLLLQVLRDAKRYHLHESFFAHLHKQGAKSGRFLTALAAAERDFAELLEMPEAVATLRIRPLGARLAWLQWAAAMLEDGTETEVIEHFLDRRVGPRAPCDDAYLQRIRKLVDLA